MSALLLAAASALAAAAHLWFASIHWPRNRFVSAYLVVVAGLYLSLCWSYGGLWSGGRDAAAHLELVGFVGQPLILHPAVLLIAYRLLAIRSARAALGSMR